jgi:hypothetical protein
MFDKPKDSVTKRDCKMMQCERQVMRAGIFGTGKRGYKPIQPNRGIVEFGFHGLKTRKPWIIGMMFK